MAELSYLSLGWGVQSFTMAVMMVNGDLPMVDVAIHADTRHETQATYTFQARWLPWLKDRGMEVVTVAGTRGSKAAVVVKEWGTGSVMIPVFTLDKVTGKRGQIRRQCTNDWKIRPMRRHLRERLGKRLTPGAVEAQIGISLDEWPRMRSSDDHQGLAEVALGMTRRVRQRHEHLPCPAAMLPDVVLDDGVSAVKLVLVPEPLEDALGGVALFPGDALIILQDAVDHAGEELQLGTPWRDLPPVARWR